MESIESYDKIICDIASAHYYGKLKYILMEDNMKEKIIQYAKTNKEYINNLLFKIKYRHRTSINYSPAEEIIAIISGKPYLEYIANDIDQRNIIKLEYYRNLVKSKIISLDLLINEKCYQVMYDTDSGNFKISNNEIQIKEIYSVTSSWFHTRKLYEILINK